MLIWIFLLLFRPSWVRLPLKQIVIAALLGIFGYAFFDFVLHPQSEKVSVTLAALLLYTYPFWVNIFSHFFTHDKISKKEALCLVAASCGFDSFIVGPHGSSQCVGLFWRDLHRQ